MYIYEDNETFWLLPVREKRLKILEAKDIVISNFNEISLN
jgi:hypothetical protein